MELRRKSRLKERSKQKELLTKLVLIVMEQVKLQELRIQF